MENIDKYVWYQEGPGVRKNQYTTSGVKLLNVANLVNGNIDLSTSNRYIAEEEANGRYHHFLVDEGDLIIASSGIQVDYFDKKMGIAKKEHLPLCMNTSTIRFKVLDSKITNIKYFMWFLKSEIFKRQLSKLITGSAQLNFGPSHLKKIKIDMPELKIQNKIVSDLDKVQEIIEKKKNQIEELEELIRSQFMEMFGDIKDNRYKITKLSELTNLITDGEHKKPNYTEEGEPFISVANITTGDLKFDNCKFVSKEDTMKFQKRCKPQKNDVLYTKVGTYGKSAIVNTDKDFSLYVSVCLIKPKKELINPIFLNQTMRQPYVKRQADKCIKGIGVPDLHLIEIKNFNIIVPPISLQNKFAKFVEKTEKQKLEIQKSLKEMQQLKESLMSKYFKY